MPRLPPDRPGARLPRDQFWRAVGESRGSVGLTGASVPLLGTGTSRLGQAYGVPRRESELRAEMWEREPEGGRIPELIARYVRGLYEVAHDNRLILQALMAGPRSGDPALGQVAVRTQRHFASALARIHRVITIAGGAHGYPLDPPATAAVTAGMIIAAAVHQDWLLPDSSRELDNERLIAELTTMLLYGTTRREPAP